MSLDLELFIPTIELLNSTDYPPVSRILLDRDYKLFERIKEIPSLPIFPRKICIIDKKYELDAYGIPLRYVTAGGLIKNFECNYKYGYMNIAVKNLLKFLSNNLHIILYWA
jgi:hypothetical protein